MWSRLSAHQKIATSDLGNQEEDQGSWEHEVVHVAEPVAAPEAEKVRLPNLQVQG